MSLCSAPPSVGSWKAGRSCRKWPVDSRSAVTAQTVTALTLKRQFSAMIAGSFIAVSAVIAMLSFLSTEDSQHEVISYHSMLNAGPTHRRSEAAVSRVMQFLPKQGAALQVAIESFGCVEAGACPTNCTLQPIPDKILMCIGNDPFVFTLTTAN